MLDVSKTPFVNTSDQVQMIEQLPSRRMLQRVRMLYEANEEADEGHS
jgi:hypothetical protein